MTDTDNNDSNKKMSQSKIKTVALFVGRWGIPFVAPYKATKKSIQDFSGNLKKTKNTYVSLFDRFREIQKTEQTWDSIEEVEKDWAINDENREKVIRNLAISAKVNMFFLVLVFLGGGTSVLFSGRSWIYLSVAFFVTCSISLLFLYKITMEIWNHHVLTSRQPISYKKYWFKKNG